MVVFFAIDTSRRIVGFGLFDALLEFVLKDFSEKCSSLDEEKRQHPPPNPLFCPIETGKGVVNSNRVPGECSLASCGKIGLDDLGQLA